MKEKATKPIQISGMTLVQPSRFDTFTSVCMVYPFFALFLPAEDMDGKTEDEIEMMKMMGFSSFDTTKVRAQWFLFTMPPEGSVVSLIQCGYYFVQINYWLAMCFLHH